MEELLKKLLEADILSEDTKTELEKAFNEQLTEAVNVAKEEAANEVKAQLSEQWVSEKDTLVQAIDLKVEEFMTEEVTQLKSDIERFRDLEAEKAQELVEAKEEMSEQLRTDLTELVEKLDTFLEIRLNAELEELREDIDSEKEKDFGRRMFEAFAEEFSVSFADEDSAQAKLQEAEVRLEEVTGQLQEAASTADRLQRMSKLKALLEPLSGRQRDIMETVLSNVPTDDLEDGYKTFVGRVLKETQEVDSEKEDTVLQESTKSVSTGDDVTIVTGNIITETDEVDHSKKQEVKESIAWVKNLAGFND